MEGIFISYTLQPLKKSKDDPILYGITPGYSLLPMMFKWWLFLGLRGHFFQLHSWNTAGLFKGRESGVAAYSLEVSGWWGKKERCCCVIDWTSRGLREILGKKWVWKTRHKVYMHAVSFLRAWQSSRMEISIQSLFQWHLNIRAPHQYAALPCPHFARAHQLLHDRDIAGLALFHPCSPHVDWPCFYRRDPDTSYLEVTLARRTASPESLPRPVRRATVKARICISWREESCQTTLYHVAEAMVTMETIIILFGSLSLRLRGLSFH